VVLYLGEERIRDLLHCDQLISTIEEALAAFLLGRVVLPVRNMLTIEEGKRQNSSASIRVTPALYPALYIVGIN
jgi:ornithine cyclodeaminase/alanine dehydrogenase-like protein (mu-crystallin family)